VLNSRKETGKQKLKKVSRVWNGGLLKLIERSVSVRVTWRSPDWCTSLQTSTATSHLQVLLDKDPEIVSRALDLNTDALQLKHQIVLSPAAAHRSRCKPTFTCLDLPGRGGRNAQLHKPRAYIAVDETTKAALQLIHRRCLNSRHDEPKAIVTRLGISMTSTQHRGELMLLYMKTYL
jgi:hypothetical protein